MGGRDFRVRVIVSPGSGSRSMGDPEGLNLEGLPFFERTVMKSTLYTVTVPKKFVDEFGTQIKTEIWIESSEEPTVLTEIRVTMFVNDKGESQVKFGKGWRDFAASNRLQLGDRLRFTLYKQDRFYVSIVRQLRD